MYNYFKTKLFVLYYSEALKDVKEEVRNYDWNLFHRYENN